jgi:hypothetical protein
MGIDTERTGKHTLYKQTITETDKHMYHKFEKNHVLCCVSHQKLSLKHKQIQIDPIL